MKTSLLVSSFAAMCLMIIFAESPYSFNAENNNAPLVNNISYIPANKVIAVPPTNKTEKAGVKTNVTLVEDFSYLKFNVAEHIKENEPATEADAENSFNNLKFDVTNYSECDKTASFEEMVLPVNEFENLKFDVTKYNTNTDLTSPAEIELPVNELQHLKFDIRKYSGNTELTLPDAVELPVNEFEYLEFNVARYTDKDELNSDNINELPVDEFSYLRFDIK